MYNAAKYIIAAAKELRGIGEPIEEYRDGLMETAQNLLNEIEVDEEENRKVETYEQILREQITE